MGRLQEELKLERKARVAQVNSKDTSAKKLDLAHECSQAWLYSRPPRHRKPHVERSLDDKDSICLLPAACTPLMHPSTQPSPSKSSVCLLARLWDTKAGGIFLSTAGAAATTSHCNVSVELLTMWLTTAIRHTWPNSKDIPIPRET